MCYEQRSSPFYRCLTTIEYSHEFKPVFQEQNSLSGKMLCKHCQGITIKGLRQRYQHAPSFKALKSLATWCSLCAILWKGVVTHAGCSPCPLDIVHIHEEPIVLEGYCERFSSLLSYVVISSHTEHDNVRVPGRAYGQIALFVPPSMFKISQFQKDFCRF
jgi:hypothetical protein